MWTNRTTKTPNKESLENYILNTKIENKIDENDKLSCDRKVTVEECSYAIHKIKLNKSPGLDRLAVEYSGTNLNIF